MLILQELQLSRISGVAGLVARVHRKGFAAGLHAVDHYVYRLRRLII